MSCCKDCEERKRFEESFEEGKPYTETQLTETEFRREFSPDVNPNWLKWHWDEEDRFVKVLEDTDWKLQLDNELPQFLSPRKVYFIPEGKMHRIIKGKRSLKLIINKVKHLE